MRAQKSDGAMWCVLLMVLLSSIGAHAAATDTKKQKPIQIQSVSAVADTQASARRQGAVNVSGINWMCSGTSCSASAMRSAVAVPVTVCQGLAREVGAIRSFTVANSPLNGNELQQCNSVVPVVAAVPSLKTPQRTGAAPAPGAVLVPVPSMSQPGKAAQAPPAAFATPPLPMPDLARQPSGANGTPQASVPVISAPVVMPSLKTPQGAGFVPAAQAPGAALPPLPLMAPLGKAAQAPPTFASPPGLLPKKPLGTPSSAGRGAVVINTGALRYAGRGSVVIKADTLRYAGRGPVVIKTDTLRYAGRGPVVINAGTLRYAGRGPVVIRASTLTYSGAPR